MRSEDLISREKAYEVLSEYYHHKTEMQHKALREALDMVPPVDIDLSNYSDRLWRKAYDQGKAVSKDALDEAYAHGYTAAEADFHKKNQWIPVTELLPEDIRPVIVTWKNTDPKSYYQYIVGKHFTGTACYKNGKWYWYSSTTEDMLAEYGRYDSEEFDEAIECIAWMPLPEPWKGGAE